MSIADTVIAVWDGKFHYGWWRPITAIREADTDGNPNTTGVPGWTPLLVTPPYPDWPSGLNGVIGAASTVLSQLNANGLVDLNLTSTAAGVTRHYDIAADIQQDAIDARVFSGIHFRTADEVAIVMGTQVANWALDHHFAPSGAEQVRQRPRRGRRQRRRLMQQTRGGPTRPAPGPCRAAVPSATLKRIEATNRLGRALRARAPASSRPGRQRGDRGPCREARRVTRSHVQAFPYHGAEQVPCLLQGVYKMNGIHKFSAQVIDYAERLSDVADAAREGATAGRLGQALAAPSRLGRGALRNRQERLLLAPGEGRHG